MPQGEGERRLPDGGVRGALLAAVSASAAGIMARIAEAGSVVSLPVRALEEERAQWIVWVPVLVGLGVGLYFSLSDEPGLGTALAPVVSLLTLRALWRNGTVAHCVTGALLAVASGFLLAKVRVEVMRAPVLHRPIGLVEVAGDVELVEPRTGGGQRLTLHTTRIGNLSPADLPVRVRIHALKPLADLAPGDAVTVRARLSPPPPPALPGDYDFGRAAWFQGIGAVGYAREPPRRDGIVTAGGAGAAGGLGGAIARLRHAIGLRVSAALQGETGALATALITGERGAISEATTEAYRDAGLLHVLSISGLHMAIMAGSVFLAVRLILAGFPGIALRYPTKKWAAGAAIAAAVAYLAISGASVATVRATLMVSIMFVAVLLDRPAMTMRNVAISALLILVLWPESLLDAGFQMSFAAVISLVAAYDAIRRYRGTGATHDPSVTRRLMRFVGGIVLTTLVASLAVTPIAAYHFHKSQQLAILANVIAIPICNLVVMPSALASLVVMPLGLERAPLAVMGLGVDAMSATARYVAALPGAVVRVPGFPLTALLWIVLGGLWLALWQLRWRLIGIPVLCLGAVLATGGQRPDILAGADGSLVAVRDRAGGLALTPGRKGEFLSRRWLEQDGDTADPAKAAAREGFLCDGVGCTALVKGLKLAVARHPAALPDDCRSADILIASVAKPAWCTGPRLVLDYDALLAGGTHTLTLDETGRAPPRVATVAAERGRRPWSQQWTRAEPKAAAPTGAAPSADSPR